MGATLAEFLSRVELRRGGFAELSGFAACLEGDRDGPSHPARGAWIETTIMRPFPFGRVSHPARGAWIETS